MESQETSEWVLVIAGLMAHADGVLDDEECERLLSMLDEEELDDELFSSWVSNIGDATFLEERFAALPRPDGSLATELLKEGWLMAMADGERTEDESRVLVRVADRLGVDASTMSAQLDAWKAEELEFAEAVASVAMALGGDGAALPEGVRPWFRAIVDALPTEGVHRQELLAMAVVPTGMDEARRIVTAAGRRSTVRILRLVSKLVGTHPDADAARGRFGRLVDVAGVSPRLAEHLMDLSYG